MKFQAVILAGGKTATGIEIPNAVLDALGGGKRPLIKVTINGATYRTAVGSMNGKAMIPLSAENRALTGAAGGDQVEVGVELDTDPRDVDVPAELVAAFKQHPIAKLAFEGLSNSAKKRHTLPLAAAKTEETRLRRIAKIIEDLGQAP